MIESALRACPARSREESRADLGIVVLELELHGEALAGSSIPAKGKTTAGPIHTFNKKQDVFYESSFDAQ